MVVAILAAITFVVYNGITNQAKETAVQSELKTIAKKIEEYVIYNGSTPSTLREAGIDISKYQGSRLAHTPSGYCITVRNNGIKSHQYDSRDGLISKGSCRNPGLVSTLAGNGGAGYRDGLALQALFNRPAAVAEASDGSVYVADTGNHRIRKIDTAGNVTTFAGSVAGFRDGYGADAMFRSPEGIAVGGDGVVYVADTSNHRIRIITPSGRVSTLAGNGVAGHQDGVGSAVQLEYPLSIALDGEGNVYLESYQGLRYITRNGVVVTLQLEGFSLGGTSSGGRSISASPDGRGIMRLGLSTDEDIDESACGYASSWYRIEGSGVPECVKRSVLASVGNWSPLYHAKGEYGYTWMTPHGNSTAQLSIEPLTGYNDVGFQDGAGGDVRFTGGGSLSLGRDVLYYADPGNNRIRLLR